MEIKYNYELPEQKQPIIIIGAGGIVRDAHLPAYRKAGFEVFGITNRTKSRAETLANDFGIPRVFDSIDDAVKAAPANAVYDLTLMPNQFVDTLEKLPDGAPVLIQKPLGDYFEQTQQIVEVCKRKKLVAAVNCQLRFAPFVMAARNMIERGEIGEIYDMEVRVTVYTPWEIFPNVMYHPRLEIQQHSIHHIDLVRSFLGNPKTVSARTLRHPAKEMSSTRSTVIMDYGDAIRATVSTNHDHDFGSRHQESFIKWEGTKGAIYAKMGLLMNYPDGVPDVFEYCIPEKGKPLVWQTVELEGTWFPDAFIGTMSSLQRYAEGSSKVLETSIYDVLDTMLVVEAAYKSNDLGGIVPEYLSTKQKSKIMIASEYTGNKTFQITEKEIENPQPGEVRLKVAYCGVCGTDIHIYHGMMDKRVKMPQTIGHEMSGIVDAIGEGVTGFTVGDKVVVRPLDNRLEKPSDKGYSHICEELKFMGIDSPGAFQQYWNVPAFTLHKLPADTDMKLAALVEPLSVACHDVRMSGLQKGETAVVLGSGPIGLLIASVCRYSGADVIISEVNPKRIEKAKALGFTVVNPAEQDLVAFVREQTDGKLADVVFEVAGVQPSVDIMTEVAGIRGRIVMVAIHGTPRPVQLFKFFWKELKLIGARVYEAEDYEASIKLIASKALPFDELISGVDSLKNIQQVFETIDSHPEGIKYLIDCN